MSFKIGFINSAGTGLKTISDAVRINLDDDSDVSFNRGGARDGFFIEDSMKAQITLELDAVTQADFGNTIAKVMNNRAYPHKVYIHEPAAASQRININNTGGNEGKQLASDLAEPTYASATEFTGGQYTAIQNFSTDVTVSTATLKNIHYFYQFDLSTWIAAYGAEYLRRLTLFMQDPRVKETSGANTNDLGYIIYAYNYTNAEWVEIKRQSITVDATNQQFASLRPLEGFTSFSDFIDGSSFCQFKVTNAQERTPGAVWTLTHEINYVELIVNGFGIKQTNAFNANWRSPFTGDGYVQTLNLQEL